MGNNQIKRIVIVGGGTAGWLSANFLNALLNARTDANHHLSITLIESPEISSIGVGESTVPTMKTTMSYLGVDEQEWMIKCHATFKYGIKFVNWTKEDASGKPSLYWHPFERPPSINGFELGYYWLKRRELGNTEPFDYSCAVTPTLCDLKKSPKADTDNQYVSNYGYSYHLDATTLATYLADIAVKKGVTHVVDTVLEVVLDERGFVSHLKTQEHGEIFGDLFIDCSGFRRIICQTLKEPFISFSDALFCDSAVVMPLPINPSSEGLNPFTTATALGSGWAWEIPLFERKGAGYVYSSHFISKDSAEEEFRRFLGSHACDSKARHLKFNVGRIRNSWVKNCVAIGLSSGFIEPLEATGIYFIEVALRALIEHFPNTQFEPLIIARYNRVMANMYDHIRDFIVLHYCTTNREDTSFWRENKHHSAIPDTLKSKLEIWRSALPSKNDMTNQLVLFDETSYLYILAGMNYLPSRTVPILSHLDDAAGEKAFTSIKNQAKIASFVAPDHYQYHLRRRATV